MNKEITKTGSAIAPKGRDSTKEEMRTPRMLVGEEKVMLEPA